VYLQIYPSLFGDVRFVGFVADYVDGVEAFLQAQARVLKFEVFVNFLEQDCDLGRFLPFKYGFGQFINDVAAAPHSGRRFGVPRRS
jgi:hypothetical protein